MTDTGTNAAKAELTVAVPGTLLVLRMDEVECLIGGFGVTEAERCVCGHLTSLHDGVWGRSCLVCDCERG